MTLVMAAFGLLGLAFGRLGGIGNSGGPAGAASTAGEPIGLLLTLTKAA